MEETIYQIIKSKTNLPLRVIKNTVKLLQDGATIPFISRYRKEMTGSLDEVSVSEIKNIYQELQDLIKRRDTIIKSITEQGHMTSQLTLSINNCWDKTALEDIYLPFKKKLKTKATVARELGLEPLAKKIFREGRFDINRDIQSFLSHKVANEQDALEGARHIIAEWISETSDYRDIVRYNFKKFGRMTSKVVKSKKDEAGKFENYFNTEERLTNIPSHRVLAMLRGAEEGLLRVKIQIDETYATKSIEQRLIKHHNSVSSQQIKIAIEDALKRLIIPSIENETKKAIKLKADKEAIEVFEANLKELLLAAPLGEKNILALDPGFRTGCKVAILDNNGSILHHETIYPHPPQNKLNESIARLDAMIKKFDIQAAAIGNGTAGKETYQILRNNFRHIESYFVNEAGASIYSASALAREEFPDLDLTVRGAISIGRRLMDPLAELVKIDPKSIGVGQYQHDVNQKLLKTKLNQTVVNCVNSIGVNLNTASQALLAHISGLGPVLANNIINYRSEINSFSNRKQLLEVPRMGKKAYEQCAGFLRVKDSDNPLDNTGVHPESYPIVKKMAKDKNLKVGQLIQHPDLEQFDLNAYTTDTVGLPTLTDIIQELQKPGLDPRGTAQPMQFSTHINTIDDINVGMILQGVINNVTKFGAFVDIGIKESGLVHISQIANKFISDPSEIVKVNQKVRVKIIDIDRTKGRVSLSMKDLD